MFVLSYFFLFELVKEKLFEDSYRKLLLGYDKLGEVEGVVCGEKDLIFFC